MTASLPMVESLPWEYLYSIDLKRHLNLSVETQIVRYPLGLEPETRLRVTLPLRVLVVPSNPKDYPELAVDSEWNSLKEAVKELEEQGLITLEKIDAPTFPNFVQWLSLRNQAKYHIVHFIGHGGYDERKNEGVLIFEDKDGYGVPIGADRLTPFLRDHRSLRVVFLNACDTSVCMPLGSSVSIAQKLAEQGISCVVGMQSEILDTSASLFATRFYEQISRDGSIDLGIATARLGFLQDGDEVNWGVPVLYLRSSDGLLFKIDPGWKSRADNYQFLAQELLNHPILYDKDWLLTQVREGLVLIEQAKTVSGDIESRLFGVQGAMTVFVEYLTGMGGTKQDGEKELLDSFQKIVQIEKDETLKLSAATMYFRHIVTRFVNSMSQAQKIFQTLENEEAIELCSMLMETTTQLAKQEIRTKPTEITLPNSK